MITIGVVVQGDRQIALKLDQFPKALHDPLRRVIEEAVAELAARVRAAMPSKTGKARSEVVSDVFDPNGQRIVGYVSVDDDFAKIGALEYGAHRSTRVSSHSQRLDHAWRNRLNAPLKVLISTYTRKPNIAAHRMFRDTKEAMGQEISAQLQEVVNTAAETFNAE